jgi:hypothetical protein
VAGLPPFPPLYRWRVYDTASPWKKKAGWRELSIRSLFLLVLLNIVLSNASPLLAAQEARVYDCVRFADNGNDIIVDNACLVRGLRNGADPNWINRENKIHISTLDHFIQLVSISRDPKVLSAGTEAVKTLIGAGVRLQATDAAILFWPIAEGRVSLVGILLDLGASPSVWPKAKIGTALSPVEEAAARGHDEIVDLLVKHGATRPNPKTALQERFVESAKFGGIEELATLVSQGAIVNGKSRGNETALINTLSSIGAPDCKALATMRWLLEKGADANLDGRGLGRIAPPLHQAILFTGLLPESKRQAVCADQILIELIKHGARVAGRDSSGRTPLHIAAERNYVAAGRILLRSGSTVMPRDKSGRTPLDMAESGEMIKLLKQHGATER